MKTVIKTLGVVFIICVIIGAGAEILDDMTSSSGTDNSNSKSYGGYSYDQSLNSGNIYDYSVPDYAFNNYYDYGYGQYNGYSGYDSYGGVDRTCPLCSGSGTQECTSCHGSGRLYQTKYSIDLGSGSSTYEAETICGLCEGTGKMMCWGCYGTGEI